MEFLSDITPSIFNNPKGVDVPIQEIQIKLGVELPWLTKSFGKAIVREEGTEDDLKTLPFAYDHRREYIPLNPDDTVEAYSFMYETATDTTVTSEGGSYRNSNVSLVFFCNLELINRKDDTLFEEQLIEDVLDVLTVSFKDSISNTDISISKLFPNAFEDFDTSDNRKWFSKNIAAFKINFDLTYQKECFSTDFKCLVDQYGFNLVDMYGNVLCDNGKNPLFLVDNFGAYLVDNEGNKLVDNG